MSDPLSKFDNIQFNAADLWREETYTDRATGTIRVMLPVTPEGAPDPTRATEYHAQTQVMTNAGLLPVEGPIEATSLPEAVANFGKATKDAMAEMLARMREYQREAASQIVTPSQALGGGLGGGMGGGLGGGLGGPRGPVSLR